MSLVGPRPPLPGEVEAYEHDVRRRLLVKPGLTGLWQVSGRSNLSWQDSVRLDLYYVENWSLAGDLVILLRTVRAVFRSYRGVLTIISITHNCPAGNGQRIMRSSEFGCGNVDGDEAADLKTDSRSADHDGRNERRGATRQSGPRTARASK